MKPEADSLKNKIRAINARPLKNKNKISSLLMYPSYYDLSLQLQNFTFLKNRPKELHSTAVVPALPRPGFDSQCSIDIR